jgi:hypothetical protein
MSSIEGFANFVAMVDEEKGRALQARGPSTPSTVEAKQPRLRANVGPRKQSSRYHSLMTKRAKPSQHAKRKSLGGSSGRLRFNVNRSARPTSNSSSTIRSFVISRCQALEH